jgi:hypothetical protein
MVIVNVAQFRYRPYFEANSPFNLIRTSEIVSACKNPPTLVTPLSRIHVMFHSTPTLSNCFSPFLITVNSLVTQQLLLATPCYIFFTPATHTGNPGGRLLCFTPIRYPTIASGSFPLYMPHTGHRAVPSSACLLHSLTSYTQPYFTDTPHPTIAYGPSLLYIPLMLVTQKLLLEMLC